MKKNFLSAVALVMLFSCQNETTESAPETNAIAQRGCASQDVLLAQMKADPKLALRMNEIEAFTQKSMASARIVDGKFKFVVNVLYRTTTENSTIQSQIDVLNKDFNAANSDFNQVPTLFAGVKANVGISFVLEAVYRKATTKTSWVQTMQ
jgi:hypothetical protein